MCNWLSCVCTDDGDWWRRASRLSEYYDAFVSSLKLWKSLHVHQTAVYTNCVCSHVHVLGKRARLPQPTVQRFASCSRCCCCCMGSFVVLFSHFSRKSRAATQIHPWIVRCLGSNNIIKTTSYKLYIVFGMDIVFCACALPIPSLFISFADLFFLSLSLSPCVWRSKRIWDT